MLSLAQEIVVARLSDDPSLLSLLAEKLLGAPLIGDRRQVDATLRLADPEEVRPDLLLVQGARGPWDAVEVQRRIDPEKGRRWPVLVSLLRSQRDAMGDLWVITASKRTAQWALEVCAAEGPRGTAMRVVPVVLLVSGAQIDALLDAGQPKLAFFAAWAMQNRRGPAAERAVRRAIEITEALPKPLRRRQFRDIFSVLNRRLVATLKEKIMEATRHRTSRFVRQWEREMEAVGEARAKRKALLTFLAARHLLPSPSTAIRAQILACTDLATLDRWIESAATATSLEQVLTPSAVPEQSAQERSASRSRAGAPRRSGLVARRAQKPA